MKLTPSTSEDAIQIQQWTDADPWHKGQHDPDWWLTGNGYLSFCLRDDDGPVLYARIDDDGDYMRMSVPFAPEAVVSKKRLIHSIVTVFPKVIEGFKTQGKKGVTFDSESPRLIRFMGQFGFKDVDGRHTLTFGE